MEKRRQALVAALKDPSEAVRAAAALSLEALEGLGSLDEILDLLKRGNRAAKIRAIYALGKIGGEKVLPPLLYCISRPEEDIKSAAIEVLGSLANDAALPPLVEKLKDAGPAIRAKVLAALANFRDPSLVPVLLPFLDVDDGFVDAEAARTLGLIGNLQLEDRLISLMQSRHPSTREAAAAALGKLALS